MVLSPAVPLLAVLFVKDQAANLRHICSRVWPPHDHLLLVETHAPWVAATIAFTACYVVYSSGWSFATMLAMHMVPEPNRERLMQQQQADSRLFSVLAATGGMAALLHCPLILRSVAAASQLEQGGVNVLLLERWSRVGSGAVFTAALCLVWLGLMGPSLGSSSFFKDNVHTRPNYQ